MREPKQTKVKTSSRYPQGIKFTGAIKHRGVERWVPGSYGKKAAWREAGRAVMEQIDRELDHGAARSVPTVGKFAGVTVRESDNRVVQRNDVTRIWPWGHMRSHGSRGGNIEESSAERHAEALRPFVRLYEDRLLDSFDEVEAKHIAEELLGAHTIEAVRRLWADAIGDKILPHDANVWYKLVPKKKRRIERDDFRILNHDEIEGLYDAALRAHRDDYRKVIHLVTVFESQLGIRPGEIWGMEHENIDLEHNRIYLVNQIDSKGRIKKLPKNKETRYVPLFPESKAAYLDAPRLNERFVIAAPRGGYMTNSAWSAHWDRTCLLAGLPGFEFYELRHRSITWMATPPHWRRKELNNAGGLGLDLPTVAKIVGHMDPTGATIAKYYLHLDQNLAVDRALAAYHDAANGPNDQPHLRVVGE